FFFSSRRRHTRSKRDWSSDVCSSDLMELHHSKHHATYVKGANTALEKLAAARESGDFSTVNQFSKDLAFNLGGHTNHSIFWKNRSEERRVGKECRCRRGEEG